MELYVTFVRNLKTGDEFVSTRRHESGAHRDVLQAEFERYPSHLYRIFTTYTVRELEDVLESTRRFAASEVPASYKPAPHVAAQPLPAAGVAFRSTSRRFQ